MKHRRWIALLLCAALIGSCLPAAAAVDEGGGDSLELSDAIPALDSGAESYGRYIAEHGGSRDTRPDAVIRIEASDFSEQREAGAYVTTHMGREGSLCWEETGGVITWPFQAAESGWYQLAVTYCAIPGENGDVAVDILLDGAVPFAGAANVDLRRQYMDETYLSLEDNAFATNLRGDEIRPALIEQEMWQTQAVRDSRAEYPGPLYFYLEAGEHTLSLRLAEGALFLGALEFGNPAPAPAYSLQKQQWDAQGAQDTSGCLVAYEAEKSYLKNALTLFATYDTAQVHVTPASPSTVNYNIIGKNTWREAGQEITWEFDAPEDGYYYLAFKVKQRDKSNAYSVRAVTIDGQLPFAEAEVQKFPYSPGWYVQCLQDAEGAPARVYLAKGRHVLGMRADLDEDLAELLRNIDQVTAELRGWYRDIVRVIGVNADSSRITIDLNRDFNLEKTVPGLLEGLRSCQERLEAYYGQVDGMEGISASSASSLKEMSTMLANLIKQPKKIAKQIEIFRTNLNTLATYAIDMRTQPLAMDKFFLYSPDVAEPEVGGGFFSQLAYRFSMFINSFLNPASAVSGSTEVDVDGVTLRVWISTADITTTGASSGRDQAILLKKLIDESFTARTGINVEVSLVSGSDTLVQAVLAGEGPDVALFTSVDTPVNLAMRGVALELSQFEGFAEVCSQFTESAVKPFRYKGGCYALPETQNFNVVFYRTDIFEELGLEPPETWEEFYDVTIRLANQNYMVGVPQNQNSFETFLYQMGGTFYTEDLSQSTFDTNEALLAFEKWTDLYTKYSLSLIFDFFNRFRSGEMGMAIMPYNQVNYLYSAAQELDGLWSIAPIPGTVDQNGRINNVETSTSTGCIGLKNTKHPEEVYSFLRWWVSEETQADFGIQLEQTLGVAARYGTANLGAFERLPWQRDQADVLRRQRASTVAVEQIPGSYYIARNLAFAFRSVVYNKTNLRETLYKYNIEINKELERKSREFNY